MTHLIRAAAIAALAFASPGFGHPADADAPSGLVGAWVITSEGRRGPSESLLTVEHTDAGYRGTWVGPRGNELEVDNLQIDGTNFSFGMTLNIRIMNVKLTYRGTLAGDAVSGTIDTPRGQQPFTGARRQADSEAAAD